MTTYIANVLQEQFRFHRQHALEIRAKAVVSQKWDHCDMNVDTCELTKVRIELL